MQLVEEGKVTLDAPVAEHLGFAPRNPRFADPITLRMLLTHRAQIRDHDDELTKHRAGNALEPFLRGYLLDGKAPRAAAFFDERPGTTMHYSNVGAALAALVVERAAGEDFAALSARRVFAPLHMVGTRWTAAGETSAVVAVPYAYREGEFVALPQASHAVYPAVDLHSTAHDLGRFARAILREGELDGARILEPSGVRAMLRADALPGATDDASSASAGDQALAWQLRTLDGVRVVGHEGEDAGATTALFLDLRTHTAAVVLANGDAFGSGDAARAAAVQTMLAELLAQAR
jgi:CubicO group peptidase (beta-lactamase class C family)